MDTTQLSYLVHRAIYIAAVVSMPILLVCLVLGIIISIFQAATQIHEQSLTFVPKIVAVIFLLMVSGGWMASQLVGFVKEAFTALANVK